MKRISYLRIMAFCALAACSQKDTNTTTAYKVNESQSSIEWKGSAPTHFHRGAFKVSGTLQTNKERKITGGDFNIPIASISNFDLSGEEQNELLKHLKSSDFFNVAIHPEARFHITKVEDYTDASSPANAKITGEFTMIGATHSISFPAIVKVENGKLSAEGNFTLNRLNWGMNSYNDPEKGLYILPDVDLVIKIYSDSLPL